MADIREKAILIWVGNLNLGLTYLITTVTTLDWQQCDLVKNSFWLQELSFFFGWVDTSLCERWLLNGFNEILF